METSMFIRTKDNIYKVVSVVYLKGKKTSYMCTKGVIHIDNVIKEAKTIEELIMVEDLVAVGLEYMRLEKERHDYFVALNMRCIEAKEVEELFINISDDKQMQPTWKQVASRLKNDEKLELD